MEKGKEYHFLRLMQLFVDKYCDEEGQLCFEVCLMEV